MSRIYNRPPLIEALCEFQFAESDWDWTIPGLVYQQIEAQFPTKRQASTVEFEVQADPDQVSQRLRGGLGRMQFVRADETALVQVGPHLLVINQLHPYPRWSEFKPLVLDTFEIYRAIAKPAGFERIGLRFINHIRLPGTEVELSAYFNFGPRLPEPVDSNPIRSLFLRVDLAQEPHLGHLVMTLATAPNGGDDGSAWILDLDFATLPAQELVLDAVGDWVEQAHDRIEIAFEACLTDHLREIFEEVRS